MADSADVYDIIVLGAGAAGMTAASVAAVEGKRVLVIEKTAFVGGTTAWSGGMVWAPANRKMAALGLADNIDRARLYLAATVPGASPLIEAFLAHADETIAYLEAETPVRFAPVAVYPDYYPELPGATAGGRVLEPVAFDARALGQDFALLRPPLPEFTLFGGMMISRRDIPHFRRLGRSVRSTLRVGRLLARHAIERTRAPRGTTLYLGNALAGRLLLGLRKLGVEIVCGTTAVMAPGAVDRLALRAGNGARRTVEASSAVVLATGGFSHDAELRRRLLPAAVGQLSAAAPGNSGDGIRLGIAAGGEVGSGNCAAAFFVPASCFQRRDGTTGVFPHTVTDRAKPGVIAVDRTGRRFVNEAISYHEFVLAMLRNGNAYDHPAYLVCDSHFLWKYGLGRVRPCTRSPGRDSGLVTAPTIESLAGALGIAVDRLSATVAAYNRDARDGRDLQFGRGGDIYQRYLGDADMPRNPCVAPIERPPFHALAVYPADLGTAAGLVTDANARVLRPDGTPVPKLYACGNDMNSVMKGAYPGPGITLGPALVFGTLAARHAAACCR